MESAWNTVCQTGDTGYIPDSVWQTAIPDSLLLEIFSYLELDDLGRAGRVCTQWTRIAEDESLWQQLAKETWKIHGPLLPQRSSWKEEVKRLFYHVPVIETSCIDKHTDEVLDVAISNNGKYFCTVSKDSKIILWELDDLINCIGEVDTSKDLNWSLTQYSLFNSDDSRVLVCGVRDISADITHSIGAGAVYTVPGLQLAAVFHLEPFTLFGAWLDNSIFIAGLSDHYEDCIHMRAYSCDDDILTEKDQEVRLTEKDQEVPLLSEQLLEHYINHQTALFSYEGSRLHQMNVITAKVPVPLLQRTSFFDKTCIGQTVETSNVCTTNSTSNQRTCLPDTGIDSIVEEDISDTASSLYDDINVLDAGFSSSKADDITDAVTSDSPDSVNVGSGTASEGAKIPASGYRTYVILVAGEHDKIIIFEVTDQRIEEIRRQFHVKSYFTHSPMSAPDHVFHIKDSYITGLCLSPDHRYAYFNHREVCHNTVDEDEELKTTFSSEVKVGMIDLVAMEWVKDVEYKGHVGFSSDSPWYICLNVSQDFIVSGSEDGRGYLWEKNYNIPLGTLDHKEGVVNGVAFSPVDQETCITVCDDKLIKVWRSRQRHRESFQRKVMAHSEYFIEMIDNSIGHSVRFMF